MAKANVCVVWLDSDQAKLFQVSEDRMLRETVNTSSPGFFRSVAEKLSEACHILVIGPENLKKKEELRSYLVQSDPGLAKRVVGYQTAEHVSDPQVAAFAIELLKLGSFRGL